MALAPGTRLGPYEVGAQIGAGGMGEVYRATDCNLGRQVAIKTLPDIFANDPERLARFEREAKTLASLNHPNIAIIHGFEKGDGVRALVMELIEGETLADRLARGPIPVDDALLMAKQMAEALEAAHEQGVIHRDLKPANVKIRPDGTVKVLDFGLAKALDTVPHPGDASRSPTITSPAMTRMGVILGTAAYMSPEQAKGRAADKRSDLWAFGCVLYEMLAGTRAFAGDDVSDTLAAVLRAEPDWTALPQTTPAPIRRLLRHCLAKDPKLRIADASTARIEIIDAQSEPQATDQRRPLGARRTHLAWAAALAVGALTVAGAMLWLFGPATVPPPRLARFSIALPAGQQFSNPGHRPVAVSPDGAVIVYTANQQLYMRPIGQLEARSVRGTGGVAAPLAARGAFFSHDGQWVGFWQDGRFKKVSIAGGAPIVLCAAQNPWGASWTADNTILYGQGTAGIWRVSGDGGTPENLVKVDAGQIASAPQLLPGGHAVLFTLSNRSDPEARQIVVQSLDTGVRRVVVEAGSDAHYVPTGHVVYALAGTLLAVPFDAVALTPKGGPIPLVDDVAMSQDGVMAYFAVSNEGTLVYVPRDAVGAQQDRTLVWVDRQGRETAITRMPSRRYTQPRLSPDETRIALVAQEQNNDIWIWDLAGETLLRLTLGPAWDQDPVWTPDGKGVIFSSGPPGGPRNVVRQSADGTGPVEQLTHDANAVPKALTRDGDGLVFIDNTAAGGAGSGGDRGDVMLLPLVGERRPRPLVRTQFSETNAELSPDGRWLAYQSNESGQEEIFVRPFPNVDTSKKLVARGSRPLWARGGRELFYVLAGAVMSVPVTTTSTVTFGKPNKLFEGQYFFGPQGRTYDVSADGQRFLMFKLTSATGDPAPSAQMILVQNWFEELKRRVPTEK
jgi:eukaryotic-like serine/threonine-protein kinase